MQGWEPNSKGYNNKVGSRKGEGHPTHNLIEVTNFLGRAEGTGHEGARHAATLTSGTRNTKKSDITGKNPQGVRPSRKQYFTCRKARGGVIYIELRGVLHKIQDITRGAECSTGQRMVGPTPVQGGPH